MSQLPLSAPDYDVRDPLPAPGTTTLLEASAGTGKTWTIAALVARYVAEGVCELPHMLVVTFTRAASQELRQRVRQRLDEVEQVLADPARRPSGDGGDALLDHLVTDAEGALLDPDELARRRARVRAALAEFDSATIVTIHQFCQTVLRSLGVAGDTDAEAELVEDLDDELVEVVDDLYLRDHADGPHAEKFWRKHALEVARAAVGDPAARLEPADADPDTLQGVRFAFAHAARQEVDRRKRRRNVLSYDDLLGQLAHALEPVDALARHRMRDRWRVVLIDEFQDTDPVQWKVFDRAFSGHAAMVLIGDPKQAIYGFRGGDVATYLEAKATATTICTLGTNRRSDAGLVRAVHALLRGAQLGDSGIVVHDVAASHPETRLAGLSRSEPVRLRFLDRHLGGAAEGGEVPAAQAVDKIAADLAADVKRTLLEKGTFAGAEIEPRHIAVLAHKRRHLEVVQRALAVVGVPAVIAGGGSIFETPAADEWLTLLEALEQPHRADRVRAASLSAFFGHIVTDLTGPDGDRLTELVSDRLRFWVALLAQRGVAAVFEDAVAHGLMARVLAVRGGERLLTDLQHLGQALHSVAAERRLGPVALLAWLHEQIDDDVEEVASDRTRRLDSDAKAVQLVTIHGSKGLEYPLVHLPFLADRWLGWTPAAIRYHDPADGHRCLDVGGKGPGHDTHRSLWTDEDAAESLRTLYVAMTRAQAQLTVWYAPTKKNTPPSPLHRVLFAREPGGPGAMKASVAVRNDTVIAQRLDAWARAGAFVWSRAEPPAVDADPLPVSSEPITARRFGRALDLDWQRTSYTALSSPAEQRAGAAALSGMVGSEPERPPRDDEDLTVLRLPEPPPAAGGSRVDGLDLASPLAAFPAGAQFGTLVHAVLEHVDPAAPDHGGDLGAELRRRVDEAIGDWPVDLDPAALAAGLLPVLETPLGPLAPGATLRSIAVGDRLSELDFELPLAGGDRARPGDGARLRDLAPILRRHLPEGDPVRSWADELDRPALGDQWLRGYLTGSVDAVLRVKADDGSQRYLVADYKTNWLGSFDDDLVVGAYTPDALRAAMGHSSYPLQALLYAVVAHRFLRWRLRGYDPDRHLGGVLYLYVRGMAGAATPVVDGHPCGVFSWRPPVALVTEVSDLLDGHVAEVTP